MSAPNVNRIVMNRGVLYADVTSLTAANYGGTALGEIRDIELRFLKRNQVVTAEEWGGKAVNWYSLGEECVIAGILRGGTDPTALNKVFDNSTAGTSSGERVVKGAVNGTVRAGYALDAKAFKLLFAPDDTARGQFVVVYKAIPLIEEAAIQQMRLGAEQGIAVSFWGIPETSVGSTKAVYQMGRKEDLAITAP